ncbi:DUF3135 domain-containing protein [Candidatus Falkowbacteria bacterium]|jgi:hypothetical protein|nr:DUF3135 domain-containing protein [Candidatus Falkowbacteria bacterium]MBT4432965.1 DUF3135 domain-containing protein [Candidatus Falkowbacteria bacterium]
MDWHKAVDLEKLNKLAEINPEGFEKKVKAITDKFISSCGRESRKMLVETQVRINSGKILYKADLPDDLKEFEIKRRTLIDELLQENKNKDVLRSVNKLQVAIDNGLNEALFNLERLEELAESDLDLFEKEKEILVLRYILSQPQEKRHKAKQSQWKIDAVCKTAKNRLDRLVKFQTLFYKGVYGEGGFVDSLKSFSPVSQKFQESATKVVAEEKKQKRRAHLTVMK